MATGRQACGATLLGVALCAWAPVALAQADSNANPRGFALDLFQGPVLATGRVVSMGGAYAGLAEGTTGTASNAASVAVRPIHAVNWLSLDLDASIAAPSLFNDNDFDNSGDSDAEQRGFIYLSGGALLQMGVFGAGISGDVQRYRTSLNNSDQVAFITLARFRALVGGAFLDGQLALGGGVRGVTLGLTTDAADLTMAGFGPEVGMLIRPNWLPFRAGVTYRHRVPAATTIGTGAVVQRDGTIGAGDMILPSRVELPWELELGVAVQVGPRPFNPIWINPHDHEQELRDSYRARKLERQLADQRLLALITDPLLRETARKRLEQQRRRLQRQDDAALKRDLGLLHNELVARAANWPRESLLLSLELLMTGSVDNAIGLQRFLSQGPSQPQAQCEPLYSGASTNFSPRAGIQVEAIPGWLATRLGSYYEPNRFTYVPSSCGQNVGRQHVTFGADLRLFTTDWFGLFSEATYKISAHADIAPRYQNLGLSFGIWR